MISIVLRAIRFIRLKALLLFSKLIVAIQVRGNNISISKPYDAHGVPLMETFKQGKITVGTGFRFNSGRHFNVIGRNQKLIFQVWGNLTIGSNVRMSGTTIICKNQVTIEDNVMFGGNVVIYDTDFHSLDASERNSIPENTTKVKSLPVTIKEGAFIGGHSTILKGTSIGENSVIGAGSVVAGTVPPKEIWAGNPARFIKNV